MDIAALLNSCRDNRMESHDTKGLILQYLESIARIEDDDLQKRFLKELIQGYVLLERRVDGLLKNTLPEAVAEEIKFEDRFTPREYECTILFSDFVGFTRLAEEIPPVSLIETLDHLFSAFDGIINRYGGTKIKTIGDAYMAVFGAPQALEEDHAVMAVKAALAMQEFLYSFNREGLQGFEMRIGIHTGCVMAGVVGRERMQFDVFGDHVNIAARFESAGQKGRINVSGETYRRTKDLFAYEERGMIEIKNKPRMKGYFVLGER